MTVCARASPGSAPRIELYDAGVTRGMTCDTISDDASAIRLAPLPASALRTVASHATQDKPP
jgi:hypothetical protein